MAFEGLIGQNSVKKKLNFYLEAFNSTGNLPFLLFVGAKGLGKTEFARDFGKNILNKNGQKRTFIEINSSTISSTGQFLEQIFVPHLLNKEATLFFDEAHSLPKDLIISFLSIFNTEKDLNKIFIYKDAPYEFDFKKISFVFATTESDKIFAPFKDRLVTIDFDSYSGAELSQIFVNNLPEYTFDADGLEYLSDTFRGNARNCIHRVKDVQYFAKSRNIVHFSLGEIKQLCDTLDILPQGLSNIELRILNILKKDGRASLQALSAKTGLSRTAIQKDFELHLLQKGYMEINGQREITIRGRNFLESFK